MRTSEINLLHYYLREIKLDNGKFSQLYNYLDYLLASLYWNFCSQIFKHMIWRTNKTRESYIINTLHYERYLLISFLAVLLMLRINVELAHTQGYRIQKVSGYIIIDDIVKITILLASRITLVVQRYYLSQACRHTALYTAKEFWRPSCTPMQQNIVTVKSNALSLIAIELQKKHTPWTYKKLYVNMKNIFPHLEKSIWISR